MGDESYQHLELLDPATMNPPLNVTLVVDDAGLDKVEEFLNRVDVFGADFETNICDFYRDRKARTFQVGNRDEQYVVDLLGLCGWDTQKLIECQGDFGLKIAGSPLERFVKIIEPVIQSDKHLKVGQNIGFDYGVMWWALGLRMWNVYSVDIAEKLLYAGLVGPYESGHWAMDDLVAKYMWKRIDKSHQKTFDLETPLTPEQVMYAGLDTRLPLGIRAGQLPKLEADRLSLTNWIEQNAVGAFEDMHIWGFFLNGNSWMELLQSVQNKHTENIKALDTFFIPLVGRKGELDLGLDQLEEEWRNTPNKTTEDKSLRAERRQAFMAARKKISENNKKLPTYDGEAAINYDSTDQLLEALRKIKGLNKTTLADTNDDTLKKLEKEFPVIAALREFRTTQKKLSTYGAEWLNWIKPTTGRVHSRFNQLGTDTGRASSAKPNLYNLPKEQEVRSCWQAQKDVEPVVEKLIRELVDDSSPLNMQILKIDMSGAELRILAELALAKSWLEAFAKDWDIHSVATEISYAEKWSTLALPDCAYFHEDHKKCKCPEHNALRDGTKATHFLMINGGGPRKLSIDVGCPYEEAIHILNTHQGAFPDIWGYLNNAGLQAKMSFESRSIAGRRRRYKKPTWEIAAEKLQKDLGRNPTSSEVRKKYGSMFGNIERQGKNTPLQATNADIAKIAMGAGKDADGKPFLWHILWPKYKARLVLFVYDELVVEVADDKAEECAEAMADAIKRAGAMLLKHVEMKSEFKIGDVWLK